ncbi:MAG: hypothetical protein ACLT16_10210 [[Clostridium] innocuum]
MMQPSFWAALQGRRQSFPDAENKDGCGHTVIQTTHSTANHN